MSEMWPVKTLGEIATVLGGSSAPQGEHLFEDGIYPFIRTADVGQVKFGEILETKDHLNELGIKKLRHFKKGTILIPKSGASTFLNHRVIMGMDAYVASHLAGIKADDAIVEARYLLYALSRIKAQDLLQENAYPSLNLSLIKEIEIPVPPMLEQQRIVSILDNAFNNISNSISQLEIRIQDAKELFLSSVEDFFKKQGKTWEEPTLLELLERGWITSHLDGNHGGDYPRKSEFIDEGVRYISANCIRNETVDLTNSKFLSPERAARLRKGIAQDGDVLFAHNATVGPVAILRTNESKIILGTSLTYYRCNPEYIIPEYLAHYMRSYRFTNQYVQIMRLM